MRALLHHAALGAQADAQAWKPAGHEIPLDWLALAGAVGTFALGALWVGLVARAFLRRARYRAEGVLSASALAAVHAELVAAERRTCGEIVPVVLERSDEHSGAAWLAALVVLGLGTAALAPLLPSDEPLLVLLVQLACAALGFGTAKWLPDFERLFVREARATDVTEEQAFQEFYRQRLHETEAQTGVLVLVSLFERRVVVLGDAGIDAVVTEDHWKATSEALLEGVAAGSLADGLIAGIRACGAVLAEHFPWKTGDRNEVPDRLIVRRE